VFGICAGMTWYQQNLYVYGIVNCKISQIFLQPKKCPRFQNKSVAERHFCDPRTALLFDKW
jgi:hypothetical protein